MLKYWPFKQSYLLILMSVIMAFAAYKFAITHTLDEWRDNKKLKLQVSRQNDVADQPDYLERKNANLDEILKLYRSDTLNYRSEAITTISIIAGKYNVRLTGAPVQDKTYRTEKYLLQKLSFAGDYFSLIRFLQQVEATGGIGKLRSCTLNGPGSRDKASRDLITEVVFEILIE